MCFHTFDRNKYNSLSVNFTLPIPSTTSDGQGFVNPCRFMGKGKGHSVVTLTKPLPTMQVEGYLQFSGRVKP